MMKDVIIKIDQNSMVYKQDTVLGISYENLQGKLIFKFLGTFPDGTAYLEYERGIEKGYIPMNKVEETYEVEIKSSLLTKEGRIYLQLRVTENSEPEGIPVFKSNKFYLEVKEAINATTEIPDEYPEWIDTANEKIKEMDNINITTERVEDGVNINVTGKDGKITTTEVKDGVPGPQGPQGAPGAVKMQVVDTLPDTGETDTIYLLKKEKPGVQNLYDEYVYTDSGWEHIGDTSVDLSDYYTKEESDEKYTELKDYSDTVTGKNITGLKYNVNASLSNYNVGDALYNIFSNVTFCNAVKNTTNSGEKMGAIYIGLGNVETLQLNLIKTLTYNGNPAFNVKGLWFYNNDSYIIGIETLVIKKDYSGLATADGYNILTLKSKIVNEDILSTKQDKLTAGDNITISEDNVISAMTNGNSVIFTDYVADSNSTNDYKLSYMQDVVAAMKSGKTAIIMTKTENSQNNTSRGSRIFVSPDVSSLDLTNYSGSLWFNAPEIYRVVTDNFGQHRIQNQPYWYRFSITLKEGNVSAVSLMSTAYANNTSDVSSIGVLGFSNEYPYTPTKDYHPATKKYVDDQIGNINTILATLTTVSEVSE